MFRILAWTNPRLFAGGEMLEIEDPEQVVLELDQHASLEPRRLNGNP